MAALFQVILQDMISLSASQDVSIYTLLFMFFPKLYPSIFSSLFQCFSKSPHPRLILLPNLLPFLLGPRLNILLDIDPMLRMICKIEERKDI